MDKNEQIKEIGSIDLKQNNKKHRIKLITIIGEIEGHEAVSGNTKATKYEHLLPILADVEDNEEIVFVDGVSEDGCIELYDTTFNGTLVEFDGNFVQFKDVYAFEVTNALLVNENTYTYEVESKEINTNTIMILTSEIIAVEYYSIWK